MASDGWDQLTTARLILASLVAVAHSIGIFGHPFGLVSDDAMILFGHVAKFSVLAFFLISGLVIGRLDGIRDAVRATSMDAPTNGTRKRHLTPRAI